MSSGTRVYSSARRSEQAAATRQRIAAAARRLFVDHGFAGTTVEMIAREAEVATPTVYATYGSKRAILMSLLDDVVNKEVLTAELAAEPDPRKQLRLIVALDVRLFTDAADVVAAVRAAGASDPEFAELRVEGENRRRLAASLMIHAWAERGALRRDLPETEALDILWALSSDLVYNLFVHGNHWPVERYEEWLYRTLESQLLA